MTPPQETLQQLIDDENKELIIFFVPKQSIREAMEKDKTRVTADLNPFFGHKPGPAIVGDVEGISDTIKYTIVLCFVLEI